MGCRRQLRTQLFAPLPPAARSALTIRKQLQAVSSPSLETTRHSKMDNSNSHLKQSETYDRPFAHCENANHHALGLPEQVYGLGRSVGASQDDRRCQLVEGRLSCLENKYIFHDCYQFSHLHHAHSLSHPHVRSGAVRIAETETRPNLHALHIKHGFSSPLEKHQGLVFRYLRHFGRLGVRHRCRSPSYSSRPLLTSGPQGTHARHRRTRQTDPARETHRDAVRCHCRRAQLLC